MTSFTLQHNIITTSREFVQDGQNSFWAYDLEYATPQKTSVSSPAEATRPKVDYRETLSEQDFAKFSKCRDLRKECAHNEGLPVYAIFTNEQLAQMVQQKVTTRAGLGALEGVGKAKLDKYATLFLPILCEAPPEKQPDPKVSV